MEKKFLSLSNPDVMQAVTVDKMCCNVLSKFADAVIKDEIFDTFKDPIFNSNERIQINHDVKKKRFTSIQIIDFFDNDYANQIGEGIHRVVKKMAEAKIPTDLFNIRIIIANDVLPYNCDEYHSAAKVVVTDNNSDSLDSSLTFDVHILQLPNLVDKGSLLYPWLKLWLVKSKEELLKLAQRNPDIKPVADLIIRLNDIQSFVRQAYNNDLF